MAKRTFKPRKGEDGLRPEEDAKPKFQLARMPAKLHTPTQVHTGVEALRKRTSTAPRPSLAVKHWHSTGLLVLDLAINRGIPGGRIMELSGPEGCGKSTLALQIGAEAQQDGGRCDFFDLEVGGSKGSVTDMGGVNTDNPEAWELWRPESAEEAMTQVDGLISVVGSSGRPAVIIVDSVPALVPVVEHQTPFGEDPQMAGVARMIMRLCRRIMVKLDRFPSVLVLLINHVTKPFKPKPFEPEEYHTPGGRAMRYYSSLRLRFDRTVAKDMVMLSGKKEATKVVRRERVKMTVWKNRFGSSHREVILPINYMTERPTATRLGFDDARGCLEFLRDEKHLLNYKNEEGKSTGYWYLDGDPTVRKLWRNWVLAYNTDETVRDLVRDVVLLAAADKWAPDTGDLDEGFDLGQGEEPEQPVPAPTKPKAKAK